MSTGAQSVDAEIGAQVLAGVTEDELVELFHESSSQEERWRIVDELADRRRGGQR